MEKDYSAQVEKLLPETKALANVCEILNIKNKIINIRMFLYIITFFFFFFFFFFFIIERSITTSS